jgi:hypothetical protein
MSDNEEIGMDRDTSAPKDKMKKKIPRILKSNNNNSNPINNIEKSPENEEEENEEEEEEDEQENEKEQITKNGEKFSKNNTNENNNKMNSSKNNNIKDEQKNGQMKINIKLKNNENVEMVSSSCQVNLTSNSESEKLIQELKLKINTLENEKLTLLTQQNEMRKKYEEKYNKQNKDINTLSLLNNKLKKNLEKMNEQVTKLLNQVVQNNSIPATTNNSKLVTKGEKEKSPNISRKNVNNIEDKKDENDDIKALKEKLRLKDLQIKDSLQTIELLKKQNKQLKEDYESITSDGKNINQNHKLVEEIKKKNVEIRELEKEYKNIITYKSGDQRLEYYKNKVKELKSQNDESKSKINQLKQILEKYQKKDNENKKPINTNNPVSPPVKNNNNSKISKLKIKKEGKSEVIINEFNNKKYALNKNFSLIFNDLEKKTLFTLFPDEGDFERFNQKLDVIENNYNTNAKRFQNNINELKGTIDDKEELIAYLREKIRENEMKIKILLNQIHLERNKNEKRANNQKLNEKTNNLNKSRAKSPKKDNN